MPGAIVARAAGISVALSMAAKRAVPIPARAIACFSWMRSWQIASTDGDGRTGLSRASASTGASGMFSNS